MKRTLERLLSREGQSAVLYPNAGGTVPVKAFIRLVSSRSRENFRRTWSGLGEVPPGKILYIGPADADLSDCGKIVSEGKTYFVRRAVPVRVGETVLYWWGLLSEGGA